MVASRRAFRAEITAAASTRCRAVAAQTATACLTVIAVVLVDRGITIVTRDPAPIFQFDVSSAGRRGRQNLIDEHVKVKQSPVGQGEGDRRPAVGGTERLVPDMRMGRGSLSGRRAVCDRPGLGRLATV